jgi:hypothetical protein
MNGEGSQSDRDTTVEVDDNVVRLTDWLGPREELIPFGPGADAEEAARASRASQTGAVPTAQDFWSESSAAVQDALTAPQGGQEPLASPPRSEQHGPLLRPQSHARRGRASAAAIWGRRRALLRSRPEATSAPRTLPRRSLVGVLCLVLVATLVLVLSSGVLTPGAVRRATLARADPAGATASASASVARRAAALAAASHALGIRPVRRAARGSGSHHPSSVQRARLHSRQTHHRAAPASVAAAQPVGYTTPAPATASSSTASPSYSSSAQTASTSASPAVTDSGQKASSAQPALGANGSLGPGSSPDG